ncbi:MAG: tape measure protein [Pseudomonadota bacterium]
MRKVLAVFDAEDGPFLRSVNRLDSRLNRFERTTDAHLTRIDNRFAGLGRGATRLAAVFATAFSGRELVRFSDQATRVRNAMREMGDESQGTFEMLFQESTATLTGFETMAQGAQRFHKVLQDRQPLDETVSQVATLNRLLALGGRAQSERASTMLQFSQALNKGYLDGEELRSIAENAPVELLDALAQQAGGTRSQLKELGRESLLTTEVMIGALQSLEAETKARFSQVELTWGDAMTVIQNGAIVQVEALDQALGASDRAIAGMRRLGEAMGENPQVAENFATSLQLVATVLAGGLGGRAIQGVTEQFRSLAEARNAEAVASAASAKQARQTLVTRRAELTAAQASLQSLQAKGAAQTRVDAGLRKLSKAQAQYQAASVAATAAVNRFEVAQDRLNFTTRAAANSMLFLRRTLSFFGGVPGLVLMGATALTIFAGNAKSAGERFDDALTKIDGLPEKHAATRRAIEADTEALAQAQERLTQAIADQGDVARITAEQEVAALEKRIAKNRELAGVFIATQRAALDAARSAVDEQRVKLSPKRPGDQRLAFTLEQRDARIGENIRSILDTPAADRSGKDKAYLSDYEAFIEDLMALQEREQNLGLLEATLRERSNGSQASNPAANLEDLRSRQAELLDTYADGIARLEELALAKSDAEKALQSAIAAGDTSLTASWREALANIDAAIDGTHVRVRGSLGTVAVLRSTVTETLEAMRHVPFDENGQARAKLLDLDAKLEDALYGGHELDQQTLDGFVAELDDAVSSAYTLTDALADASKEARDLVAAGEASLARQRVISSTADPVARAGALAGLDFDRSVSVPDAAPDGAVADIARQRAARVAAAEEEEKLRLAEQGRLEQARRLARSTGSEQKRRLTDAQALADRIYADTRTVFEEQAEQTAEITAARATLVEAYGAESDQVARLDEATRRLGQVGAEAFAGIANTMASVIARGGDLSDVLTAVFLQLLEMNGVAAFQALFAGGGVAGFGAALVGANPTLVGPPAPAFAMGGVMTPAGPVPLRRYAKGGIAYARQFAEFGEGAQPEAFVPLPDGRTIPVTLDMPAQPQALPAPPMVAPAVGTMILDASLAISLDGSGLTMQEVKAELEPVLARHQAATVRQVQRVARANPGYLET